MTSISDNLRNKLIEGDLISYWQFMEAHSGTIQIIIGIIGVILVIFQIAKSESKIISSISDNRIIMENKFEENKIYIENLISKKQQIATTNNYIIGGRIDITDGNFNSEIIN